MVLVFDEHRFVCVQETLEGEIVSGRGRGEGGFGYDPLLYLPGRGRTVAELGEDEKNRISHRAKAARAIAALLASGGQEPPPGFTGPRQRPPCHN
jgi:XTP/dITP diphosphohydrolase